MTNTNEEIIKACKGIKGWVELHYNTAGDYYVLSLKDVVEALEKQIPKKVIEGMDTYRYCSKCNAALSAHFYKAKYCHNCGQRLNWEDE